MAKSLPRIFTSVICLMKYFLLPSSDWLFSYNFLIKNSYVNRNDYNKNYIISQYYINNDIIYHIYQ